MAHRRYLTKEPNLWKPCTGPDPSAVCVCVWVGAVRGYGKFMVGEVARGLSQPLRRCLFGGETLRL
jgi:hypothetical protein